ncbi:hypothetical protein [Pontibacter mucosus]|nr:hypothetical protein [Pontibacter mucosus]
MDILYYLFLYLTLNADTMSKEEQLLPEETQVQTAAETDGVPPADKPRPPKNPEPTED